MLHAIRRIPISCFMCLVPAGRPSAHLHRRPAPGYSDDIAKLSWTLSRYRDQKKVHDSSPSLVMSVGRLFTHIHCARAVAKENGWYSKGQLVFSGWKGTCTAKIGSPKIAKYQNFGAISDQLRDLIANIYGIQQPIIKHRSLLHSRT